MCLFLGSFKIKIVDKRKKAKLVLKDGTVFEGYAFGALKSVSGEAVFNTGMVGYPEALTDPSYFGQILIFTYPLIGNYGVPPFERNGGLLRYFESEKIQLKGIIVSDYSFQYSHWLAEKSLGDWLKKEGVPGIFGIDTRALTKKLREEGTMPAKIISGFPKSLPIGVISEIHEKDILDKVSCKEPAEYGKGDIKIALLDCGTKQSIIKALLERGVKVIRVPYNYDVSRLEYAGLVISNGPGDPKKCKETVKIVKKAMERQVPIFGICLGNQILALAAGADTYKLKYGHRSQNQPCRDVDTGKCYITSQNHGFAVDKKSLSKNWRTWFLNINDQTIEGIRHKDKPFFAVQFHPEACPGPLDTKFLFDDFIKLCAHYPKRH